MNGSPEYSLSYRPNTPRSNLNLIEKSVNHLFASTLYGCGAVALGIRHFDKVLESNFRYPVEFIKGYEVFYRNLNLEGQLPFRPSIHPK